MARTTLLTLPVKDHIIETLSRNSEMSVRELYQDLRKYFIEKLTAKYPHLSNKEVMVLALPLCDRIQSNFGVRVHSLI